jgi:GTP-binding protein EngB required for normal cell division
MSLKTGIINRVYDIIDILKIKNTIPKVIVVGDQGSGKSSIIANILQIKSNRIMPTTTKYPIHFKCYSDDDGYYLKCNTLNLDPSAYATKNDMYNKIYQVLNNLPQTVDHATTIKIYGPDIPNISIIDLPGLTIYPQCQAESVKMQYDEYLLKNPNAIILCTSPITTSNIYSSITVAYLMNKNLTNQTILVLTMADKLVTTYEDTIDSVIVNSLRNNNFYATIITAKNHYDNFESSWFSKNVTIDVEEKCTIIGSNNLMPQIDVMRNNYIRTDLVPILVANLKIRKDKNESKLSEMMPDKISSIKFREIFQKSLINVFRIAVEKNLILVTNAHATKASSLPHYVCHFQAENLINKLTEKLEQKMSIVKKIITNDIAAELKSNQIGHYKEGFAIICNHIDNYSFSSSFKLLKKTMNQYVSMEILSTNGINAKFDPTQIEIKLNKMYNSQVIYKFLKSIETIEFGDVEMWENNLAKNKRTSLINKIENIKYSISFLTNILQTFD